MSQQRQNPPVIVGISRAQLERAAALRREHAIEAPPDAMVVVVDPYKSPSNALANTLVEQGGLKVGSILVLSPFGTGEYVEEHDAEIFFTHEKCQLVSELCQLLGAVRVESDLETLSVQSQATKTKVKVGKKVGRARIASAEGHVDLAVAEEWKQLLKVDDTYAGGDPQIQAARDFAKQHHLTDPLISRLIDSRAAANSMHERRLKVVFDGSRDSNLNVAAAVHVPQVSVEANVNRRTSARRRVTLTLAVKFPTSSSPTKDVGQQDPPRSVEG